MHHQFIDNPYSHMFRTLRGAPATVRPAVHADTILLADLLSRLSEHTRHLRYLAPRPWSAESLWSEAARMARGHAADHLTLMAIAQRDGFDQAIAVAELARDSQAQTSGEIAIVVCDDEQQQGIGSFLLWRLVCAAQQCGMTRLHADMLAENRAMLRLIGGLGLPYTATTRHGETQVIVSVPAGYAASVPALRVRKLAA